VNVSIPGGQRVEMKNINSLRKIKEAIEIELKRQEKNLPKIQETRMYDEENKTTKLMRTKDNAQDYRFISDPDLPSIILSKKEIEKLKKALPETPQNKLKKLTQELSLDKKSSEILTKNIDLLELFEEMIKKVNPKIALQWITLELLSVLNYNKITMDDLEIDPQHFIELLQALEKNKITELQTKDILRKWVPKSFSPLEEIEKNSKIGNSKEIESFAKQAIKENTKAVNDYKQGEMGAINFLIGAVMKLSNKRADYKIAKETLERLLK
jgi:aspartyl-tRNA(Asn)/glutamyl-tRNA(Gln) amidotransferase subunit B